MLGVFSEFEREIIRERVNAGLAHAKAQGKTLGRPRDDNRSVTLQSASCGGRKVGINKIARRAGNWRLIRAAAESGKSVFDNEAQGRHGATVPRGAQR